MCFDIDSEPPIPRIAGAALSHDDLVLTAADGNDFAAFVAAPEAPRHNRRGDPAGRARALPFLRGARARFAERGHLAIVLDYFGRTAGVAKRTADWEYMPHVEQTTDDSVQADTKAVVAELRARGATSVFSVGFCFGGRASWIAAASGHGLAGSIGFYGSPTRERGGASVVQRAAEIECAILALQAGDDQGITADDNALFEQALASEAVEHEIVIYDGAPHSFFDRKQEDYAVASEDAWRRTLAFISQRS